MNEEMNYFSNIDQGLDKYKFTKVVIINLG